MEAKGDKKNNLLLGAHLSIAGGLHKALESAQKLGCNAVQIFTIAGFRCPSYVKGINVPGFHLYFISEDKTKGEDTYLILKSVRQRLKLIHAAIFFL